MNSRALVIQPPLKLPQQWKSLAHAFIHQARIQPGALAVRDSLGTRLTYNQLLIRSIALANYLSDSLSDSQYVGILIPPSVGAVIANIALTLLGKITVNLNYVCGQKMFDSYVRQCRLKHIVTSKLVLKKLRIEPKCQLLFLDSVEEDIHLFEKITAWLEAEIVPENILVRLLQNQSLQAEPFPEVNGSCKKSSRLNDPATIIFTSGSTGDPKGVMLSHENILSNVSAIKQHGQISDKEMVLGVIPFFHSFGFTMTLWAPLCLGETVVYHYDPFDARRIGSLCERYKITCLVSTPTILSSYLRRCGADQFSDVRTCIVGGEKIERQQLLRLQEELDTTPLEGYGLAETSPVVSCNVPAVVTTADGRSVWGTKPGTVGLPLPGTSVRIVGEQTGEELAIDEQGIVQVKGPQVMLGYLDRPAETAKAVRDGWFSTGDVGFLDEDGFLTITGRLSQFSKIAGEMVPHLAITDELLRICHLGQADLCVTAVPDEIRGERLVVLVSGQLEKPASEIVAELSAIGMPKLWIPDERDFFTIPELPLLPSGKLNLQKIKEIAAAKRRHAEKIAG
ncbi:MAG: AMP-binding protein [Cyanobacteria bacterium]|nr:AMP-binding protein [Cyanobacteriota bacterium]